MLPDSCGCGLCVCIPLLVLLAAQFGTDDLRDCCHALSCHFSQNAKVSVMGSGQLSQVMQTVSRSVSRPLCDYVHCNNGYSYTRATRAHLNFFRDPSQHASLKAEIEAQSSSLYATARLWDDGIIKPTETRDVVGLGLALAARPSGSFTAASPLDLSGISWNGERGRMGGFGVYRM